MLLLKTSEDIKLDKIGKLLEQGGTMLAQHCECGAPLFRYQGSVLCPVCESDSDKVGSGNLKIEKAREKIENTSSPASEVPAIAKEHATAPDETSSEVSGKPPVQPARTELAQTPPGAPGQEGQDAAPNSQSHSQISRETGEFIHNTLVNKIVQLCLDLQRETDPGSIKQQMEAIESGTRALKNLR